jgi:hypothetical protein
MKSFDLISTEEAFNISSDVLKIEFNFILQELIECIVKPHCPNFLLFFSKLNEIPIEDTPKLRHFLHTSKGLIKSAKKDRDPDPSCVSHFFVDSINSNRVFELHCFKGAEILFDYYIKNSTPFEFSINSFLPQNFNFFPFYSITIPDNDANSDEPSHFSYDKNILCVKNGLIRFKINLQTKELENTSNIIFSHGFKIKSNSDVESTIPIHDNALCEPYFATAPILRGTNSVKEWIKTLEDAFHILSQFPNNLLNECIQLAPVILPLHNNAIRFGSASCEEVIGLTYLPAVNNQYDVAECLLHEAMHQKLFRLETSISILEDGTDAQKYYSPWRSDPRPLRMCMHGAYVFTGVSEMWLTIGEVNQNDKSFQAFCLEQSYYRAKQSLRAISLVLKYGKMTLFGSELAEALSKICLDVLNTINTINFDQSKIDNLLEEHEEQYSNYIH